MTPDRIEFWKNNTTPAYKLTKRLFEELAAIEPTDLEYENNSGLWNANYSAPCETESLVYRLRPGFVEPVKNEEDPPLKPWECHKDSPNGIGLKSGAEVVDTPRDVTYIGSVSELAAAGITADSVPNGIKIESGEDRVFATGAKRQASAGKGLPSLLPPDALLEISKHLEAAASKYGSRNWEKGLPLSSILDSLLRHIYAELMGDTSEAHARAIGCNTLFYIATKKRIQLGQLPSELDDLPKYLGTKQGIKNETV